MILPRVYNRLLPSFLFFVIQLQSSGVTAETMCVHDVPVASPKMLTTFNYPAMVTAIQCKCMIISAQPIRELDIHIRLRRSDQTTECSRTQMTIVHRNLSYIVCPTADYALMSDDNDDDSDHRSFMTISLSLTQNDRPMIILWNTHLEFINAQVILTSEHSVAYNIVCTSLESFSYWPYENHSLELDDGIDTGIKVAAVVLVFILAVLLAAAIRLIKRLRARKAKFESKKQKARLKRISKLNEAMAFNNLGFSSSTLNHSSSSNMICHYVGKLSHDGSHLVFPTADSRSRSTLGSNSVASEKMTGHGCIWPLQEDEPHLQMVNRPRNIYV